MKPVVRRVATIAWAFSWLLASCGTSERSPAPTVEATARVDDVVLSATCTGPAYRTFYYARPGVIFDPPGLRRPTLSCAQALRDCARQASCGGADSGTGDTMALAVATRTSADCGGGGIECFTQLGSALMWVLTTTPFECVPFSARFTVDDDCRFVNLIDATTGQVFGSVQVLADSTVVSGRR